MRKFSYQKGFTLIELLIVIVIIGILAGVLIAVIDPTTQQNRARDATVRATMNKVAMSTSSYVSSYGRIPQETEFLGGMAATDGGTGTCAATGSAECLFAITASALPRLCTAGNQWGGTVGLDQCFMRYCGGDDTTPGDAAVTGCTYTANTVNYRLFARAYGSTNVFMYRSADSTMYLCDLAGANCTAPQP